VADIFEEVDEQLRSDRYLAIVKRTWPMVAGAAGVALVLALGLWGWDQRQSSLQALASQDYDRGLQALSQGNPAIADRAFSKVAKSGPRGYRTLALMQVAGLRLNEKKTAEAMSLLDQAAGLAPDHVLADAARMKAALIAIDAGLPLPQIEARLTPLIAPDRPYHVAAREALAMARLAAGKPAAARADFSALSIMLDASDAVRGRAQAALSLIDSGAAANLPAVVKALKALPEPARPALPQLADSTADPAGAQ
jgi:hypothetical protein